MGKVMEPFGQLSLFDELEERKREALKHLIALDFSTAAPLFHHLAEIYTDVPLYSLSYKRCLFLSKKLSADETFHGIDAIRALSIWRELEQYDETMEYQLMKTWASVKQKYFLKAVKLATIDTNLRERLIAKGIYPHRLFAEIEQWRSAEREITLVLEEKKERKELSLILDLINILLACGETGEARKVILRQWLAGPDAFPWDRIRDYELLESLDEIKYDVEEQFSPWLDELILFAALINRKLSMHRIDPETKQLIEKHLSQAQSTKSPQHSVKDKLRLFTVLSVAAESICREGRENIAIRRTMRNLFPQLFTLYLRRLHGR